MDLAAHNLSVNWGRHLALAGVTASFPSGARVYLGGTAGAGKTSLLKALAGLLTPREGTVLWDGQDVRALSEAELAARQARLGMVFQSDALFDSMTVLENVLLPLERRGVMRDEAEARATEALTEVGLAPALLARPEHLSGGMKKRAGLARALVARPEVLLCDDPLAGLDPQTSSRIAALLESTSAGRTLIVSASEPPEGLTLPRWLWLSAGKLVHDGAPDPSLLDRDEEAE